ncbi:MAG: hypothetical protein DDT22_01312 [candidate division WS2 bacterium]|nr:hypothetical protein [Candidatus Lithacetigena glycinireducens]MBT9175628.1 hypothetical protein [Candidatus Lithacetigena glycinireducens]
MIIDAVLRNLEVIGEASRKIPEEIKEQYPHIPWKRMISLRNITIHEYFGIDPNIIWVIITQNLPGLKTDIEILFQNLQNRED